MKKNYYIYIYIYIKKERTITMWHHFNHNVTSHVHTIEKACKTNESNKLDIEPLTPKTKIFLIQKAPICEWPNKVLFCFLSQRQLVCPIIWGRNTGSDFFLMGLGCHLLLLTLACSLHFTLEPIWWRVVWLERCWRLA